MTLAIAPESSREAQVFGVTGMTMTQCGWPWAAEEKAQGGEGWHGLPSPEPETKWSLERIQRRR